MVAKIAKVRDTEYCLCIAAIPNAKWNASFKNEAIRIDWYVVTDANRTTILASDLLISKSVATDILGSGQIERFKIWLFWLAKCYSVMKITNFDSRFILLFDFLNHFGCNRLFRIQMSIQDEIYNKMTTRYLFLVLNEVHKVIINSLSVAKNR